MEKQINNVLYMGGYNGDICIEGYHDPVYRGKGEMTTKLHGLNYLEWYRGEDFVAILGINKRLK